MAMINDIVETLIEELRELPDGTETTIGQLVTKCGYNMRQLELDDQMLAIYGDLLKAARKAHITLDWSAYKNMVVGLPYNIPFVVKNIRAQIKCPRCGSTQIARILYGMPAFDEDLVAKINRWASSMVGMYCSLCWVAGRSIMQAGFFWMISLRLASLRTADTADR